MKPFNTFSCLNNKARKCLIITDDPDGYLDPLYIGIMEKNRKIFSLLYSSTAVKFLLLIAVTFCGPDIIPKGCNERISG